MSAPIAYHALGNFFSKMRSPGRSIALSSVRYCEGSMNYQKLSFTLCQVRRMETAPPSRTAMKLKQAREACSYNPKMIRKSHSLSKQFPDRQPHYSFSRRSPFGLRSLCDCDDSRSLRICDSGHIIDGMSSNGQEISRRSVTTVTSHRTCHLSDKRPDKGCRKSSYAGPTEGWRTFSYVEPGEGWRAVSNKGPMEGLRTLCNLRPNEGRMPRSCVRLTEGYRTLSNKGPYVGKCFSQPQTVCIAKRFMANYRTKIYKREQKKEVIYQYAPDDPVRTTRVYIWGYAGVGALGVPTFLRPKGKVSPKYHQVSPHRLMYLEDNGYQPISATCGYGFTVLTAKKRGVGHVVLGTGINTDSQIGYQEAVRGSGRLLDYIIEPAPIPLPLQNPDKTKITHVACGRAHTVIATDTEGLLTLGNNSCGQCARNIVEGEIYSHNPLVNRIPFEHPVRQVICGHDHTVILTESGLLYTCGLGADGQTGLGHYECADSLTLVRGDIEGEKIVHISGRSDTMLAVSDKGDVFGWGNNEYHQLEFVEKDETQVATARHLPFRGVGKVLQVAAGGTNCALLNDKGDVYVWGYGILGKGPQLEQCSYPSMIPNILFGRNDFNPDSTVISLTSGLNQFAAITNKGDLYMWGKNKTGELGIGSKLDQFFPLKVALPAMAQEVSCGVDHMLCIGKSYC